MAVPLTTTKIAMLGKFADRMQRPFLSVHVGSKILKDHPGRINHHGIEGEKVSRRRPTFMRGKRRPSKGKWVAAYSIRIKPLPL